MVAASRAAQSAPLPHIGPTEPSRFQKRKMKWTGSAPPPRGSRSISPSAPTPCRRSQRAVTIDGVTPEVRTLRPSRATKSFPDPVSL